MVAINMNKKDRIARAVLRRFMFELARDVFVININMDEVVQSLNQNNPKADDGDRSVIIIKQIKGDLNFDLIGVDSYKRGSNNQCQITKARFTILDKLLKTT